MMSSFKSDKTKPKLLIIGKLLNPDIGGVETVIEQHREILSKNFEVTAWGGSPRGSIQTAFESSSDSFGIKVRFKGILNIFNMPISPGMILRYFREVSEYDEVMVHCPFPIGSILCLTKRPRRLTVIWHSDIVRPKALRAVLRKIDSKLCQLADRVITTSENLARHSNVLSRTTGVSVVPIATPSASDQEAQPPRELGEPTEGFFLYLGRISYYKGLSTLLDAYERYEGSRSLIIAGAGKDIRLSEITDLKKHDNITVVNRSLNEAEKEWLLRNCYALVFPSILESEAFGIVQLEAMRFGKPVINTALQTGVPEVARHLQEALTYPPGDVDKLYQCLTQIDDTQLYDFLSINATKRAKVHFSQQRISDHLLETLSPPPIN